MKLLSYKLNDMPYYIAPNTVSINVPADSYLYGRYLALLRLYKLYL